MKIRKFIRKAVLYYRYATLRKRFEQDAAGTGGNKKSDEEIFGCFPDKANANMVIYSVADSVYFDRFGRSFIGALICNAEHHALHLHLYNPREDQLDYLKQTADKCKKIDISFTWTTPNVDEFRGEDLGRYICFTRYIYMYLLQNSAKSACLIMDIDSLLVGNVDRLLNQVSSFDLGFYARFNKFYFDTKMLGGAVYIDYSRKGKQLLSAIQHRLDWFVSKGYLLEKLDQIVVYDVYRHHCSNIKFHAFGDDILDLDFTGNGIIWYPKGESRNEGLYNEKLAEYASLT